MTEFENYKALWNQYLTLSQKDKIIDGVVERGDSGTLKWFWNQYLTLSQKDKIFQAMMPLDNNKKKHKTSLSSTTKEEDRIFEYDFFICHASEDKESFVRILAEELRNKGFKVWYDEFTLTLGDSLRRKIDYGLANSRYGIVVLSKYFFEKKWPQDELDGLVAQERLGKKVILPIWHGVTREDVEKFSPILAGRVAASTHKGLDYVVREIIRATKHS